MARITVEDCLQNVNNRFELIHMASRRVRQLRKGAEPTINSKNRDIVVALREIAAGHIAITDADDLDNLDKTLQLAAVEKTSQVVTGYEKTEALQEETIPENASPEKIE